MTPMSMVSPAAPASSVWSEGASVTPSSPLMNSMTPSRNPRSYGVPPPAELMAARTSRSGAGVVAREMVLTVTPCSASSAATSSRPATPVDAW